MITKHDFTKRGISPVVATVLLIGIVIVIAIIVFLWLRRGFIPEVVEKQGSNIQLACDEAKFRVGVGGAGNIIEVVNDGTIPIHGFKVDLFFEARSSEKDLNDILASGTFPPEGLQQGGAKTFSADYSGGVPSRMVFTPVLKGLSQSDGTEKTYVCDKGQYGQEVLV